MFQTCNKSTFSGAFFYFYNAMLRVFFFLLICAQCVWAQNAPKENYREDQIYFSIGYPFLTNTVPKITQNKFSHALQAGFVRDMPINKRRNLAIGLGMGLSYNVVYNNLKYVSDSQSFEFISNLDSNLWKWTELNVPLEFRWRTSTLEAYKFWRIYGGITGIYTLDARQIYRQDGTNSGRSDLSIEKLRFALHFSLGNNTWNIFCQYPLAPLFENLQGTENVLVTDLGSAKIGLIFYLF